MCEQWKTALALYCWKVDLRKFSRAADYQGFFDRVVGAGVTDFEDQFRLSVDDDGPFERAGEVCYWKNFGNHLGRNNLTQSLLDHLQTSENWTSFVQSLRDLAATPEFEEFQAFASACGQDRGFATPITFLAFYRPQDFPMVDKHIANWWKVNGAEFGYETSVEFSQTVKGLIRADTKANKKQNWQAYTEWKRFCEEYSKRLTGVCESPWRARDVEMAVWEAQKNDLELEVLQEVTTS